VDGSYRWLSWRTATENGYVYAVARDITDLKGAEEQLRNSRHEIAEVSRHTTMGVMAASIAHEVNQPLAAVITNANAGLRWLANTEPDLDEVRAILERIVNNGHRAGAVVTGIRSMFRKDAGELGPVSVNGLIREVLSIVRGELESHQVSLRTELCEELQPVIAEQTQLQQVLLNLIMNAVDAMSAITDRDRVLIVKSEAGDLNHIAITVEDSGIGIQADQMSRIFEAFYTTKPHGMGMGLSICRSIIESHGGKLLVSARSPHGSIFSAKLPTITSENAVH
jgi:C4-dicarboxylate-specific signal transduction histidine kinase